MASIHHTQNNSCIEEMEALLDQISEFRRAYPSHKKLTDPSFRQEFRLFQQHIKWVSDDLVKPVRYNVRNK